MAEALQMDERQRTSIDELQRVVARVWTLAGYTDRFRTYDAPQRDFAHALGHVQKAAGKLFEVVDDYDHRDGCSLNVEKYVADLVICAARLASSMPDGAFDLAEAVQARLMEIARRAENGDG